MWTPPPDLLDALRAEIGKIRRKVTPAASSAQTISESDTETAVFDKLLPILGYPHLAAGGYTKQTPNNAGGIPDYTILPGTRT